MERYVYVQRLRVVGCMYCGLMCIFLAATRFSTTKILSLSTSSSRNHGSLRFMIIADWGGRKNFPFTTIIQRAVARQMAGIAGKHSPHFILGLGDNFYNMEVKGVNDTRFQSTFEEVYNSSHLFIPWYILAGNHDYSGNVQAQIEYSKYSRRWNVGVGTGCSWFGRRVCGTSYRPNVEVEIIFMKGQLSPKKCNEKESDQEPVKSNQEDTAMCVEQCKLKSVIFQCINECDVIEDYFERQQELFHICSNML